MATKPWRRPCSILRCKQPGCLGAETARGENGIGITVAYFTDESFDQRTGKRTRGI